MIGEMVCPDCGGVVGATEPTDAGPPCRCFADGSGSSSALMGGTLSGSMTGTVGGHAGLGSDRNLGDGSEATASDLVVPDAPPPVAVVKVCRVCGTDVAGHRRYKDSLGYLCGACKEAEQLRENHGRVACRVCGKLVLPENLTEYEGTKMCPKCHEERQKVRLQEIKRIGFKGARNRDEIRQLTIYLAIGGALLLIILAGAVINHFRH
jgi:hypothetical protein